MITQICSKCKTEKDLTYFSPRKGRPRGRHYSCKECSRVAAKEYRSRVKQTEEQKEKAKARSARWRKENPEWASRQKKSWAKRYPHKKLELSRRYDLTKMRRTPSWLTKEHFAQIEYFYWLAKDLQCLTGEEYHVDHIVPLQGKTVSGLHVPWNLQVIPKSLNLSKGNSYGES